MMLSTSLPKCFAAIALLEPDEVALLDQPGALTSAVAVGRMLKQVRGMDAASAAPALLDCGFSLDSVTRAIYELFDLRGVHVATIYGDLGLPSAEIARTLKTVLALPAEATARALMIGGASAEALGRSMAAVYALGADAIESLLAELGFAAALIDEVVGSVYGMPRSFMLAA